MSNLISRRALFATAALPFVQAQAQPKQRPNIIVIMADDMGFSDLGCYGSEIPTPNLDRLANNGVRVAQFYNTARCCPTRAALLTGLYNHQAGIGHMVNNAPGFPAYQGYLNDKCLTLGEVMKAAGYRTAMSGKWHVGEDRPHWPVDRGFERYFGLISGASSYFKLDNGRKMAMGDQPFTPPSDGSFYMTDAFTDHALQFIEGFKQDPYFLYLAYTSPHWPLHARPADIAKHRGKYKKGWDALRRERHERQLKLGIVDAKWKVTDRDAKVPVWEAEKDRDDMDLRMAVYAAQIEVMDRNIGRLIKKLEETKQLDNTLIMFLADNGGCAEENIGGEVPGAAGGIDSYTSYRTGWANASNTPFRLYKHWTHEGGISSPLIAHWPARKWKRGHIDKTQPGHLIDIMATCLDAAGATYPRSAGILPMEGKSMLPIFEGRKRAGHEFIAWEHEGNRALRQGEWKLVSKHPDGWELYNIAQDRTETNDLAAKDPERVKRMAALWDGWAHRCGVQPWPEVQRRHRQMKKDAAKAG